MLTLLAKNRTSPVDIEDLWDKLVEKLANINWRSLCCIGEIGSPISGSIPVVATLQSKSVVLDVGVVGGKTEGRGPEVIPAFAGLFDIARTKSIAGVAEGTWTTATAGLVNEIPTGVGSDWTELSESEVDEGDLPLLV